MEGLSFKLEIFEGPLDALLALIQKHKLNIQDIEISVLLDQFMLYLSRMAEADLEITSDFLEMAARLIMIKSAALLPREEAEQMKRELQGALIEYALCKTMAERLKKRYLGDVVFVRNPMELDIDKSYHKLHQRGHQRFGSAVDVALLPFHKAPVHLSGSVQRGKFLGGKVPQGGLQPVQQLLGSQGVVLRQTAQNFPVRQQTLPPCIHAVWGGVYRQRTLRVQGLVLAGSPVLGQAGIDARNGGVVVARLLQAADIVRQLHVQVCKTGIPVLHILYSFSHSRMPRPAYGCICQYRCAALCILVPLLYHK